MTFEEQLNNNRILPDSPPYFPEPLPDWLADEDLLRDEAVILGLSDARLEEKTALIGFYFQQQTAPLQRQLEYQSEKIGELNLLIEQKTNRITEIHQKTAQLEAAKPDGEPQFLKNAVGLLASLLLLTGTFYLIDETLRPHFAESRLIALGVFLSGIFGLYSRTTPTDQAHDSFTIRRFFTETGLPFAASFFVFVQALQTQSALKSIALFLFLFFLFLTTGKLISGLLTALRNDFRYWNQEKKLKKERETKTQTWGNEVNQLTISLDAIRVQKWQLLPALHQVETELSRINTRRTLLIHLFENEFKLSRTLRDRLTERQKRAIVTN